MDRIMVKKIVIVIFSLFLIVSCSVSVNRTYASGTNDDHYVEEQLPDNLLIYSDYLETSNVIMGLIEDDSINELYEKYFSNELRNICTQDDVLKILEWPVVNFGEMENYKQMQWMFTITEENSIKKIVSTKLVEHGDDLIDYQISFLEGNSNTIIGLYVKKFNRVYIPLIKSE